MNRKVSGTTPNTLKLTHASVVCVRQTISLSAASARKNTAQRQVSLRQPSGVRSNTESNTVASSGLPMASPPNSPPQNNKYMIVGLTLMNTSFWSTSVRPPNTTTTTAET